jgi:hypothetical protein
MPKELEIICPVCRFRWVSDPSRVEPELCPKCGAEGVPDVGGYLQKIKSNGAELAPQIISATEFLKRDFGVHLWLVQDLIPSNSLVFLFGVPGHLKTWLALYLGVCVANGKPFLNRQTSISKVLIVNKDSTQSELQRRLRKFGLPVDNLFIDMNPLGFDFYTGIAKEYGLIVFDSFIRFHEGEENSATEMAQVIKVLQQIRDAGTAVLVIHHRGKDTSQGYRGSSEILAGCDLAFSLRKDIDKLVLKTEKSRLTREYNLNLRMIEDGDIITFTELPASVPSSVTLKERIYAFIQQSGSNGVSAQEFSKEVGRDYKQAIIYLKELINDGAVYLTTTGKKKIYRCSNFKTAPEAEQRELTNLLQPYIKGNCSNLGGGEDIEL